jgi:hypothetical protein
MGEPRQDWHRLFGVSWQDFCTDLPLTVEMELDLSYKQQFLDVALIRKGNEPVTVRLPDGFEPLAAHNLITFKSHQETLDGWTLVELLGHYSNYRKRASPSLDQLLPETDFRLFAVSVRFPRESARRRALRLISDGVYELDHPAGELRIIVVHELPQQEHNALLHLFSARTEQMDYGKQHYRLRSRDTTTFLYQLFTGYLQEGMDVPIDLKEFARQTREQIFKNMSPEERRLVLQDMTPEERLEGLSNEEIERVLQARKPSSDAK